MPNKLWHQAADRGRAGGRLALVRTKANTEPSHASSWRAARLTVTLLSCLLPLVAWYCRSDGSGRRNVSD